MSSLRPYQDTALAAIEAQLDARHGLVRLGYLKRDAAHRYAHDAFLHFTRFLECLCLSDGAGYSSAEDVADAVLWHHRMMTGQRP
jgi:hypothetical protein